MPQPGGSTFMKWWSFAIKLAPRELKKGLNTLVFLVSWEVWKHRNACVVEGVSSDVPLVLQNIANEGSLWCRAGAMGLRFLLEGAAGRRG